MEFEDETTKLRAELESKKKEGISIIYILFYKTRTKKKRVDSHTPCFSFSCSVNWSLLYIVNS